MMLKLRPEEAISLDHARLEELSARLGTKGAEAVVARAMEELAGRLARVDKLYRRGEREEMARAARAMIGIADQIGMASLAQVAGEVTRMADGRDDTALAALVARLVRIGEGSLMAVWDLQDASL